MSGESDRPAPPRRPLDRVVEELYPELRRIAGAAMAGQRSGHTLQPTAIVHEAWLRLARSGQLDLADRKRFLALAARVMRQILVDHARAKRRVKRGGAGWTLQLNDEIADATAREPIDLLALDQALTRLGDLDPRAVEIFDLRYLGGLEVEEVAELLGLSATTVKRESAAARSWLMASLRGEIGDDGPG